MRRFIFDCARHGETDNTPGRHLTDRGRMQAERMAFTLRGTPYSLVLHSDTERTRDTAQIMARVLGVSESPMCFPPLNVIGTEDGENPALPIIPFEVAKTTAQAGRAHTETPAFDWFQGWGWVAGARRFKIELAMAKAVYFLTTNPWLATQIEDLDEVFVLIVSHSPFVELRASDPRAQMCLGPCDAIRYTMEETAEGLLVLREEPQMTFRCPEVE
ncbi:MAG: histidine phosphatase family protein [Candidatus Kerfeldbacteria bacterium]